MILAIVVNNIHLFIMNLKTLQEQRKERLNTQTSEYNDESCINTIVFCLFTLFVFLIIYICL